MNLGFGRKPPDWVLPAVFFFIFAAAALLYVVPTMNATLAPWYEPVVLPGEVDAALWVSSNIAPRSLFAADLFDCEMLVSAGDSLCSIGGDWELADNADARFYDDDSAFTANSSLVAWQLFSKYGIKYVFTNSRLSYYGYGWKEPDNSKFTNPSYFTKIYSAEGVSIYTVNNATGATLDG